MNDFLKSTSIDALAAILASILAAPDGARVAQSLSRKAAQVPGAPAVPWPGRGDAALRPACPAHSR